MKVLLFIPQLGQGGGQKVFIDLANHLVEQKNDVTMLVMRKGGEQENNLSEKIKYKALQKKNMLQSLSPLVEELKAENFDVALSTLDFACITLLLAKLISRNKVKVIVRLAIHVTSNFKFNKSKNVVFARMLIPFLYPKADAIISVSKEAVEDLKQIARIDESRFNVIYNPVSKDKIKQLSKERIEHEWFTDGSRIILSAGRLEKQKNYQTLIKAFSLIDFEKYYDLRLLILGDGSERKMLEHLSCQLKLDDRINLFGYVNNPYKYMSKSEIFVLPSLFEGMPNSLIQAMFCGCKLISTNCPSGPKEVLKNGKFGQLVNIGDPISMKEALVSALNNEKVNIPKEWLSNFDDQEVMCKYEKVIYNTLK